MEKFVSNTILLWIVLEFFFVARLKLSMTITVSLQYQKTTKEFSKQGNSNSTYVIDTT